MPDVRISIGGQVTTVAVASADATMAELKALAPAAQACTLLVGGLPCDDATALSAAKWDGSSTLLAVRPGVTLAEVAQHRSKTDLWMVLHAPTVLAKEAPAGASGPQFVVFDLTSYVDDHPGGPNTMVAAVTSGAWGVAAPSLLPSGALQCFLLLPPPPLCLTSHHHPFCARARRQWRRNNGLHERGALWLVAQDSAEAPHWRALRRGGGSAAGQAGQGRRGLRCGVIMMLFDYTGRYSPEAPSTLLL
jgi:hypothetical protein